MSTVSTTTPLPQTTQDSDLTSPLARYKMPAMIGLAILTAIGLIVALIMVIQWSQHPFLGALLTHQGTVTAGIPTTSNWTGLEAGLEAGDHLLSISDSSGETRHLLEGDGSVSYGSALDNFNVGDTVVVNFERQLTSDESLPTGGTISACSNTDATTVNCQATITLMSFPDSDLLAFFVLPFISGVVVFGISIAVLRMRPEAPITFIVVILGLLLTWYMANFFNVNSSYIMTPIWLVATTFLSGMIITVGIIYPQPIAMLQRYPWVQFLPTAVGAGLTVIILGIFFSENAQNAGLAGSIANLITLLSVALLAGVLYFYQRPRATNPSMRFQANILFIAVAMALAPGIIWIMSRVVNTIGDYDGFRLTIEATMPFLILPVLALAYVVLEYQRFDSDTLIVKTMTYGVMLVALIAGYFLMVLGLGLVVTGELDTRDPLLIAFTLFLISVLFLPVRTRLQRRIDAYYYRVRHDYQAKAESFGHQLTALVNADAIIVAFRNLLEETLHPQNIFIFQLSLQQDGYKAYNKETDIAFTTDSGVTRLLENNQNIIYLAPNRTWEPELRVDHARINILKAIVIASLSNNIPVNAFVTIAPPHSGAKIYNFEELRFISNLVGQVTVALERSRVINTLEDKVKELNVLSQVSQAVNYTVTQDVVFELVSAQIDRLIQTKYFYVVLLDNSVQQLHFAFFLEGDERNSKKENQRWSMGYDLYSEIIKSGRSMKIPNFVETMQERHYEILYENADTRAWMGVPMIASTGVLGVLAMADNDPDIIFTQDQLNILNDIGALAATSLDKSRLFTETETRARQLGALNQISQRLVAAEGNVAELLDLVTESAVEILNAEAGSLLLVAEDDTRDLEFRAVVGDENTKAKLLGSRLKWGYGLVGEVAESGEPVISNQIEKDERFDGEVVEGDFHTSSILAVPLIAQDRTIGVLEVINKLDGTYYDIEDQNLLITFAGQAAIALENARLFQSTDEALSERVNELQNLERFANDLNKALELERVAELTVNAAMVGSNAEAGLLCLVDETETHLKVIYSAGYPDEVLPKGAYDGEWVIKGGIVGRVIRTRSADLAPDVEIDPDYDTGLPGSLSQLTFPMIAGKAINALLILETNTEPRFGLIDQLAVQRLIEHASIAVQNAQLYEGLRLADKTKSEFVGFAAHELKNPLTSVKGYAESIDGSMLEHMSTEQIRGFAKVIVNNAGRMQSIINDLRDIAQDDAGLLQIDANPTSFHSVVLDTLIPFQKQLDEKNQSVNNKVSTDLPFIMADHNKLIQVLTNFVSNAHKYSDPDTTITIGADVISRYVNRRNQVLGDMLHAYVKDEGDGMKEEDLSKLFKESYFRSTNEKSLGKEGTGLGMMITQRLVKLHGGEIWVDSVYGEGSTFHFVIPLAPAVMEDKKTQILEASKANPEPSSD